MQKKKPFRGRFSLGWVPVWRMYDPSSCTCIKCPCVNRKSYQTAFFQQTAELTTDLISRKSLSILDKRSLWTLPSASRGQNHDHEKAWLHRGRTSYSQWECWERMLNLLQEAIVKIVRGASGHFSTLRLTPLHQSWVGFFSVLSGPFVDIDRHQCSVNFLETIFLSSWHLSSFLAAAVKK